MRTLRKIYLDTNVLISFGDGNSDAGRILPQVISRQPLGAAPLFVTSRLTFTELMVKPLRDQDRAMASIYMSWSLSSSWLRVCDVDQNVLDLAPLLRVKQPRLKLPDAIHLATAITERCPELLTADKAFADVPALEHPFLGAVDLTPLTIIRPDEPTLTALLESMTA
ncbi:type II toxin-antitoxin system VapC family toxin [Affinirhizobium pseudoryzae]|uniref:type II toxin-antitoxin system VapC family toxin n=1 Tax=Allorhizobium pseudoryzae TaxID=379684 RepID=UPI0013EA0325|nr:PIN domain-containing protein [Allorhizobium pseudoryzae]